MHKVNEAMTQLVAYLAHARSVVCLKPVRCVSGLELSVQAGRHHRAVWSDGMPIEVEVGFPTRVLDALLPFAENPDEPMETVYNYVPTAVVAAIIAAHGGMR